MAIRLVVAVAIGLLVGLEREWSHKGLGVRTFAIVSVLGMAAALQSQTFTLIGMAAVIALVTVLNIGHFILERELEITTSAALLVVFTLGALVGTGHVFAPTACGIVMTLLLSLKPQLRNLAGDLRAEEVRSAVLLGLIGFVIYPLLPDRFVDPWRLVNPRQVWLTVVLIAGVGFLNYVLLRLLSTRGLYYAAIFGGIVNSTATAGDLAGSLAGAEKASERLGISVALLTLIAMFLRNLVLLAVLSPAAGLIALGPILAMSAAAAVFIWLHRSQPSDTPAVRLSSPMSFRKITSFGLFFLTIQVLADLGQRFLGALGSIAITIAGGFVAGTSATAAVASLARHGEVAVTTEAVSTVLICMAGAIAAIPVIRRQTSNTGVVRTLIRASAAAATAGFATMGVLLLVGFPRAG